MKSLKKIILAAFALPLLMLTACNSDDDNDQPTGSYFSVFSTLEQASAAGATFGINKPDNTPMTISGTWKVGDYTQFKVGQRYYVTYTNGSKTDAFMSPTVNLIAATLCYQDAAKTVAASEIPDMKQTQYNYRSQTFILGGYLNAIVSCVLTKSPKFFGLYVDEATTADEYPKVTLVLESDTNGNGNQANIAGSFSLSGIINRPGCMGIELTYKDATGTLKTEKLQKPGSQQSETIKPQE